MQLDFQWANTEVFGQVGSMDFRKNIETCINSPICFSLFPLRSEVRRRFKELA